MALGDIVNNLPGGEGTNTNSNADVQAQIQLLRSIDNTMKQLLRNGQSMSRDNATTSTSSFRHDNTFRTLSRGGRGSSFRDFEGEFRRELLGGFVGSGFQETVRGLFQELADDMGVSLRDLPGTLGKALGRQLADTIKNSTIGQEVTGRIQGALNRGAETIRSRYRQGRDAWYEQNPEARRPTPVRDTQQSGLQARVSDVVNRVTRGGSAKTVSEMIVYAQSVSFIQGSDDPLFADLNKKLTDILSPDTEILEDAVGELAGQAGQLGGAAGQVGELAGAAGEAGGTLGSLVTGGGELGGAMAGLGEVFAGAGAVIPEILVAMVALEAIDWAVEKAMEALKPAIEGVTKAFEQAKKTADRERSSAKQRIQSSQDRLEADVRTMVETPFKILEDAANKLYETWDNNLRTITATQGYNKEEYSDLLGAFAERLRSEGLTSVINTAAISDNLAEILKQGLTGVVAEEFAYQATKLNAAVPTQDFFQYAAQYGSLVANAMLQQNMSQADAIKYATSQLMQYASDILYASREITGGIATGLQDASNIFTQAVQISQAARTNDPSQVSGVMTVISAVTGAIAPDLATAMTDAVYKAATGGNSSEIVALRSLAGINASNTEFLKALAEDPQSVFADLFEALAQRQHMSDDAYMEVAEGLSSVFGLSMDTFARVDFDYLAQAIREMDTNSDALLDNLALLASGQTTLTKEQMVNQQVNKYMIEEGLAEVLNSEAGRAVMEHMWQEQIANQITEATYGVELKGSALDAIEGVKTTVDKIATFLNPFRAANKVFNALGTIVETAGMQVDIKRILEAGRVGVGNEQTLYNLTTRGQLLNVTSDLLTLLGETSAYGEISQARRTQYVKNKQLWGGSNSLTLWGMFTDYSDSMSELGGGLKSTESVSKHRPTTQYVWGTLGKSVAKAILESSYNTKTPTGIGGASESTTEAAQAQAYKTATDKLSKAFAYMNDYISESGAESTYEEWAKKARTMYGIADMEKTLEAAKLTEEQAKEQFDQALTQYAAQRELKRQTTEEDFWKDSLEKMDKRTELLGEMSSMLQSKLDSIFGKIQDFYNDWVSYYIRHTYYERAGMDYGKVSEIQSKEKDKTETAVYALADALTQNNVDLRDPAVQTNVLLAQVLKVLNVIAQQGATGVENAISLPDTIAGMALGITLQ